LDRTCPSDRTCFATVDARAYAPTSRLGNAGGGTKVTPVPKYLLLALTVLACLTTPGRAVAPDAGAPAAAPGTEASAPPAGAKRAVIYVAKIEGMIDLGLGPFVERVLHTADAQGAAAVVLEVNTFGGRVDAAVVIRDALLRAQVPTVAFVNKRAISAGALISLAAQEIVMAGGATIGAAAPVEMGAGESKPAGEKAVSYLRKEFRATADARKRPGEIAEAMVDPDVEIEGVIEKGKLLTFTTTEALEHRVADFEAADLPALLAGLGLANAEIKTLSENWAERVVRFLTDPVVASLLMTLGMLGLFVELRAPGVGLPGAVGVLGLGLFFWGHFIVSLAGWEQLMLVAAGLVLIALEMFVFAGFGIAGVLGIAALTWGLSTSLIGAGATLTAILAAASRVAISAALAVIAALALFRFLPNLPGGRKLVLNAALAGGGRPRSEPPVQPGVVGRSVSALRPAGIALLAGRRVDVVSEGDFIEPDQAIEVVRDEGTRVVVKRHLPSSPQGTSQ
jgi:membrane-bound serine protease (ClpP class)